MNEFRKCLMAPLKAQLVDKQRLYARILRENSGSQYLSQLSREIGELNLKIHSRRGAMANPLLDAFTILHSWAEGKVSGFDQCLYEYDNGENHSIEEAKQMLDHELELTVQDLQEMRDDLKRMSWKRFKKKHI